MSPFQRVEDRQAGPTAIGILVPPSPRTFLILRPRALPWDLLVLDETTFSFREMSREEASGEALRLFRSLEDGNIRTELMRREDESTSLLLVRTDSFALVVCDRKPGQPYTPTQFESHDQASPILDQLDAVFSPGNCEQEVYFNTRHFSEG